MDDKLERHLTHSYEMGEVKKVKKSNAITTLYPSRKMYYLKHIKLNSEFTEN